MSTIHPAVAPDVASRAYPLAFDSDAASTDNVSTVAAAQADRGTGTRTGLLASGQAVDSQKVAALRNEIQNAYDMNSNDLAAKVDALNVAERNLLLRTLTTDGVSQLAFEFSQARVSSPQAYASLQNDLLRGQPPQQIHRLVNAASAWDTQGNPSGQAAAQPFVHDIASYIADNGSKGQKLGLIDLMTDPSSGGGAARSATQAEAVGELFSGLRGDVNAVNSALAMMSQSDKAAVARQTLRTDSPEDINRFLRYNASATDPTQRAQMLEQFMLSVGSAPNEASKQAALQGITATLLKSPDSTFSALRLEDQQGADALSNYLGELAQSPNAGDIRTLFASLKYGADLGGSRSSAQLEALDRQRFNAPDQQNATNRGYLVGSLQQALDRFASSEGDRNKLSRNIATGAIFTAGAIGAKLLGPWGALASLGATGLSFVNSQFNNPASLQTSTDFNTTLLGLAKPVVEGTNGRPQEVRDPGNVGAFIEGVNQARLTR